MGEGQTNAGRRRIRRDAPDQGDDKGHELIDRSRQLSFFFDNRRFRGHPGDTLASALLANGERLVGRSFKYHRPRGVFTSGAEEPNALVTLGKGARRDPNTRATVTELREGLDAHSQNHIGPLGFDPMAINDHLSRFLGAGFYYKTFMWPKAFWERVYEPIIRRAAGLGELSGKADPDVYDRGWLHAELLVVGSGPTGLAAALAAGRKGVRVILAEEDFVLGGRLNAERFVVDGESGAVWAARVAAELATLNNVRVMSRTCVFGVYDHGSYGALERIADPAANPVFNPATNPRAERTTAPAPGRNPAAASARATQPRQVYWRIRATHCIVASGATERSIAFPDNDRPGIMLAGAVRAYANRWAVASGRRVAVFTNNDDGWRTARDLTAAGVKVRAVIDTRTASDGANVGARAAQDQGKQGQTLPSVSREGLEGLEGVETFHGNRVTATRGRLGLSSITLNNGKQFDVDCLAVSGGWNPTVHLTCHQRGRPSWRDDIAAFVPDGVLPDGMRPAGAAAGIFTLGACLSSGTEAARQVIDLLGRDSGGIDVPRADDEACRITAFWHVGATPDGGTDGGLGDGSGDGSGAKGKGRAWIDLQNDVTTKDIALARQEGFSAVEHLKRYTTLGMATDQGKTSNVLGLAIMAEQAGQTIADTGTTIFRPPASPVAIGAFAGRSRGKSFRPTRLTPSHAWAEEHGAVFVEVGNWLRAQWFNEPGETHWRQSVDREVTRTRASVGICDVTTLGKIDIQGKDAGAFLDKVYANTFSTLAVGKVRYGIMLREDGLVMDDGTTARLGDHRYLMTTTTANAVSVFRHLEFCRQCLWPGLDVHLLSETEQWAQFAVAGPNSRALLSSIVDDTDLSNDAFPFMACRELTVCGGIRARLFRISFSGELAYEVAVPSRHGDTLIRALMAAGEEHGVVPYGTEALGVMRIEKGHAAGNELPGTTTAAMLGLGRMVSKKKDCVGNVLSERAALVDENAYRLVGFKPVDRSDKLEAGAHFIATGKSVTTENDEGWLSSVAYSPTLGHSIGIGFIQRGDQRLGEQVRAADPVRGRETLVEIVSPHFVDPDGERLRG